MQAALVDRDEALVRENANKDSNVYSTQRDLLAGAVSKASAFSMLPDAVSNAHMKGDIRFHDADYSPFTAQSNCSLPNYWDMLANGFTLGNAPMGSPNSISIAATQITQIMKDVASSQYGGQTANRADEHFAEYAKKDYDKFLEQAHEIMPDDLPIEIAERQVRMAKAVEPKRLHFEKEPRIRRDCRWTSRSTRRPTVCSSCVRSGRRSRPARPSTTPCRPWNTRSNSNRVSDGQHPVRDRRLRSRHRLRLAREIRRQAIFLNRIRGLGSEHHTAIFPRLRLHHQARCERRSGRPELRPEAVGPRMRHQAHVPGRHLLREHREDHRLLQSADGLPFLPAGLDRPERPARMSRTAA